MSDIVKYDTDRGEVTLSPQIIREYFCRGASDQEIAIFLRLCQYQKLNPFLRQAHLIKYGSQPASMVVGWHVFLERAERNPAFNGYEVEVYDEQDKPYRARSSQTISYATAKVFRKDRAHPIVVTVMFDEYCLRDERGNPRAAWAKIPATMIRKVALEQALRESFTKEFEGLYGPEEMGQDPDALPSAPVRAPQEVEAVVVDEPTEPVDDEPVEVRKPVMTPFAAVKHLTDLYGGGWSKDGKATQVYFGAPLKSTADMAKFITEHPDKWAEGADVLLKAAQRAKSTKK